MFKVGDKIHNNTDGYFCYFLNNMNNESCRIAKTKYTDEYGDIRFDDPTVIDFKHLHQSAQTMFEELGYLDQGGDEWHHDKLNKNIYFDVDKTISCYSYHANIPTVRSESMTIDEFKASYQMCIEKGWL